MKGVTPFISGRRILAKILGLPVRINVRHPKGDYEK